MDIFKKKKIGFRQTLGRILAGRRKRLGITLAKAEADTKVRYKFLEALETDNYLSMPADVYNIGFLERYAQYLKLKPEIILARFRKEKVFFEKINQGRRIFGRQKSSKITPGNPGGYRDRLKFVFTPQTIITALIIIITLGVVGYIWFQVKSFAAPPPLEITNPEKQIVVSMEAISVEGKTDPGATLMINDQIVGTGFDGYFKEDVWLATGINNIEIKALNKAGKETVKTIQVLATEGK